MSAEFSFLFMIFFVVTTIHKKDLKIIKKILLLYFEIFYINGHLKEIHLWYYLKGITVDSFKKLLSLNV